MTDPSSPLLPTNGEYSQAVKAGFVIKFSLNKATVSLPSLSKAEAPLVTAEAIGAYSLSSNRRIPSGVNTATDSSHTTECICRGPLMATPFRLKWLCSLRPPGPAALPAMLTQARFRAGAAP